VSRPLGNKKKSDNELSLTHVSAGAGRRLNVGVVFLLRFFSVLLYYVVSFLGKIDKRFEWLFARFS
jgi:hypothetical protein